MAKGAGSGVSPWIVAVASGRPEGMDRQAEEEPIAEL